MVGRKIMPADEPRTKFRKTLPGVATMQTGRPGGGHSKNAHPIPAGTKDKGGFSAKGFKAKGFQSGQKKIETGPPPSVRAREEAAKKKAAADAKLPPSARYATPKKVPQPNLKPLQKPGTKKIWT